MTTDEEAPAVTEAPETLWAKAGGIRGIGLAVVLLALTRVAQLGLLTLLSNFDPDGAEVRDRLLIWDADWFIKIAVNGYPDSVTITPTAVPYGAEYAFFPLYPMLIRSIILLGVEPHTAAIAAAWLASVGAGIALFLLGTSLFNRRAGWAFVVICCAAPMSVVLTMAYSEGLFLALVAAMLTAAHRRSWLLAGYFGLAAALTRPTGAAAAVALGVAAVLAARDARSRGDRGGTWKPLLAAAVALAGVPGYLAWVGWRTGAWDTWFQIQTIGWGTRFDYGDMVWQFLRGTLLTGDGFVPVAVALLLVAAVFAAGVALAGRPWPPLAVYGLIAMVLVYGQAGYYHSKPRLLFPVLLTLLPGVAAAAEARPRVLVPALVAWSAFGLWFGAYMITVWPYTM